MIRLYVILAGLLVWAVLPLRANNVKIIGDVKVNAAEIEGNNTALIKFTVEWENSWRDEFNYDAVYLFLKYRVEGDAEKWHHLYLKDDGSNGVHTHTVGSGFDYSLAKATTTANQNEGIFIYRNENNKSYGRSQVSVTLKWLFTQGTKVLTKADFDNGRVFVSAMAIEMVYIPRGAFKIGDGHSNKTFKHNFVDIPDKYNVATEAYEVKANAGDPKMAVNRRNDIYNASFQNTSTTNAWWGGGVPTWWQIDFGKNAKGEETGEKKKITYFGIEGYPGYVPGKWRLEGAQNGDGTDWTTLYNSETDGKAGDWVVDMIRTYPVTKAVKIPVPGSYRYYRVYIETMSAGSGPYIKSIAMTTEDIEGLVDSTVLTWHTSSYLGTTAQNGWVYNATMSADDGENWALNTGTNGNYPNGYPGFFAMKYEITQEQFVAFLNKLTYEQQKQRTIGQALDLYGVGDYVFGDDQTKPTARNGIIIAARPANKSYPLTFANNLNKLTEYSQDGDGQTLACNFLSAGDMLAYADWCGLRPLSEMEYEKMCHRPYPFTPEKGEYAWNTTKFVAPTSIVAGTEGKTTEKANAGNANAGGGLKGPIRVGAFAKGAADQESSGASFWGVMDLSGNLSEIYYNANAAGRAFQGIPAAGHGNGVINDLGYSDMSTSYWPTVPAAFAFRGGHYASKAEELRSSDRTKALGNYPGVSTVEQKDTTVTFRLGYTAKSRGALTSKLTLQNGRQDADTICSGEDYYIKGDMPQANGAYTFVWFKSENRGTRWEEIEGENGQNLSVKNLINDGTAQDVFLEYRYKRKMFTTDADAQSQQVIIRVVNSKDARINRQTDTMDYYGWMKGVLVQAYTRQPGEFSWWWNGKKMEPQYTSSRLGNTHTEYFVPRYEDYRVDGKIKSGDQDIAVEILTMKHCLFRDTLKLHIKPEPIVESSEQVTCGNLMRDMRDKKIYPTVEINGQCWMAKNLAYEAAGSLCYNDNKDNCDVYGRLYNWNTAVGDKSNARVKGICPDGWHIPSDAEWRNMWSGQSWSTIKSSSNLWGSNSIGNNNSRFSALPGGGRFYAYNEGYATYGGINSRNGYHDVGSCSWWWTSTTKIHYWNRYSSAGTYNIMNMPYYIRLEDSANLSFNTESAWSTYTYLNSIFCGNNDFRHLTNSYNSDGVGNGYNLKAENAVKGNFYFSVRCVKD